MLTSPLTPLPQLSSIRDALNIALSVTLGAPGRCAHIPTRSALYTAFAYIQCYIIEAKDQQPLVKRIIYRKKATP